MVDIGTLETTLMIGGSGDHNNYGHIDEIDIAVSYSFFD